MAIASNLTPMVNTKGYRMAHKKSGNKNGSKNEKTHEQIMGKDKKSPDKKDFDKDFINNQASVNSQSQNAGHVRTTRRTGG
jgi:hypothetical protein